MNLIVAKRRPRRDDPRQSQNFHLRLIRPHNPILFCDSIVLDVGCGIGILSLLATKSRTRNVYAVDASDIADKAEEIVRVNGREIVVM
jgi:2-polyprenyl-3-methyl-5-hydroxy-6-metoxy-1,4-benzoquinol methylase